MPRVFITRQEKLNKELSAWIYGQMMISSSTQGSVAKELGLTQQGLSKKLRRKSFSFEDFCFFIEKFQPDTDTLLRLTGANEWTKG